MQVPSAIVIRKEYVVLYEILENREGCMSMCGTESGQPRYTGHIVTGNPGIGIPISQMSEISLTFGIMIN